MTSYAATRDELRLHLQRLEELRRQMRALRQAAEPEPVDDYTLQGPDGPVRLSELMGDRRDLIVIHNMGAGCPYCTMWADGFNGVYDHLAQRAAFVVTSPDSPEHQRRLAQSRGWRFPMASHAGTSFAADMGYRSERGFQPGVSVFQKQDGRMVRITDTPLGPGDLFNPVFHFLDLLPDGAADFRPAARVGLAA